MKKEVKAKKQEPSKEPVEVDSSNQPGALIPVNHVHQEGDIQALLRPNDNKTDQMQPTLLGVAAFAERVMDLALWWQETRDKQRDYYSMDIRDQEKARQAWQQRKERIEPLCRLKLYQFRQRNLEDPDYTSDSCFVYEGRGYWACLWVDVPQDLPGLENVTEQDLQRIAHTLVFSSRRPVPKWTPLLKEQSLNAHEHLIARRRELEDRKLLQARRAKAEAAYDEDKIL
jgi:hypothetical protein